VVAGPSERGRDVSWSDFDAIEVRKIAGEFGVFACRDIARSSVVGVFDGVVEVFEMDGRGQVDWRGMDGGMSIHLSLSGDRLFTLMPIPGIAVQGIDFINHSCTPNCRADAGSLVVETTCDVAAGEQLTINYHAMDLIKLGRPCWCEGIDDDKRCIL